MSIPSRLPVYYGDEAGEPARQAPMLDGDLDADIVVVGGGLAGLSVALSLAERGRAPVVLEAGSVGDGASGRNGGFVQVGWAKGDDELLAALGADGTRTLLEAARRSVEVVRARLLRHQVRTLVVDGVVEAFFRADDALVQQKAAAASALHDVPFRHLTGDVMRDLYRGSPYQGGILDPVSFHVDPLALTRGYARAIQEAGGHLFEQSPVLSLVPERDGTRVVTAKGTIRAREVVLATSVYGGDPDGRARRALLPVMSYVVITEPLGERLGEIVRAPYAVFDDRFATGYWRPLADTSLLWGGKVGLSEAPSGLQATMRADLAAVFPALADVRFDHVWSGRMGFTRHRMPLAGQLAPGLWLSTGFCGHGLGTTAAVGELLADAMLEGDDRIELISGFGQPWMGGAIGPLAAQLYYGWLSLRDRRRGMPGRTQGS